MIENELTFLVKELPNDLKKHPKKEIKQGYFSGLPSPLRIRSEDENKFILTKKVKIKEDDFSRYNETNLLIKKEEFDILWPVCSKKLVKTRYYYPIGELTAEVDIFHGKLEGLKIVEVEFLNERFRKEFSPLKWFGQNITQKKWAANSVLSEMTYRQVFSIIQKELE